MGLIKIDDDQGLVSNAEPITEKEIVDATKDVFTNKTALSKDRYGSVVESLLGFGEGAIVIVEYYKKSNPLMTNNSANTSFSIEKSNVHTSYSLIHNFEFRLDGELDVSQDQDTLQMTVTGKGFTYPGFLPTAGDIFLLKLENSEIGVFVVTNVSRFTLKQATYRSIDFYMYKLLDDDILEKLNSSVAEELYFDKEKFLTDTSTILTSTSYNQLNKLKDAKQKITDLYFAEFYSSKDKTVFLNKTYTILDENNDPEDKTVKLFDPYLVKYLIRKLNTSTIPTGLKELSGSITKFTENNCFWDLLFDKNVNRLNYIYYNPAKVIFGIFNPEISGLTLNQTLLLYNDASEFNEYIFPMHKSSNILIKDPYIFSNKFYIALISLFKYDNELIEFAISEENLTQADIDDLKLNGSNQDIDAANDYLINTFGLNEFELFILNYIGKNISLKIEDFISSYIDIYPYTEYNEEERFYRLPILLFFIDMYIKSIT